eukprot:scaffold3849_cov179-Amphora_coffeaeformis.AAC.5
MQEQKPNARKSVDRPCRKLFLPTCCYFFPEFKHRILLRLSCWLDGGWMQQFLASCERNMARVVVHLCARNDKGSAKGGVDRDRFTRLCFWNESNTFTSKVSGNGALTAIHSIYIADLFLRMTALNTSWRRVQQHCCWMVAFSNRVGGQRSGFFPLVGKRMKGGYVHCKNTENDSPILMECVNDIDANDTSRCSLTEKIDPHDGASRLSRHSDDEDR